MTLGKKLIVALCFPILVLCLTQMKAGGSEVLYLDREKVATAFRKGAPLIETAQYKVYASHREGPGQAEVHAREIDIMYVLEGSATFITGGTVQQGQTVASGEIRGEAIRDGNHHSLSKGDVIIVPAGTPHWFKEVKGAINYYVVKVPIPS